MPNAHLSLTPPSIIGSTFLIMLSSTRTNFHLCPSLFSISPIIYPRHRFHSLGTSSNDSPIRCAFGSEESWKPILMEKRAKARATSDYQVDDRFSDDDGEDKEESEGMSPTSVLPERWDVLGLGQAMVDFSGMVDEHFLEKLGVKKGSRKVVNHEERGRVLRAMDGCSYKAAAGGSLSNSLVALARLGAKSIGGPPLSVAMAGSLGSDPLGSFFRSKLRRANVRFLSEPVKDGTTGTVIVLTTPDAQRTMLAYQGTSSSVQYDQTLASIVTKTRVLIVEGYLFEFPDTIKTIARACEAAKSSGSLVAITAADISCIDRHFDDYWEIIENFADVVFANSDEAKALCDFAAEETPAAAARYLSHFLPLVSVTDGDKGSYIGVKGEAVFIPPCKCAAVDTCGAGDAYASGIVYGMCRGVSDFRVLGEFAAKVAATVVGQRGTRLTVPDAATLAESLAFYDLSSDQISSL